MLREPQQKVGCKSSVVFSCLLMIRRTKNVRFVSVFISGPVYVDRLLLAWGLKMCCNLAEKEQDMS